MENYSMELKKARRKFRVSVFFLIMGLLYGIMPCDIIPDILVPFGWVDDTTVLLVVVINSLLSYRKLKHQEKIDKPT